MVQPAMIYAALVDLVIRVPDAFNCNDLDGVMAFMAENAVYDEFNGTINRGKAAICAAFVPQFRGDYGVIRFQTEDLFVDPETGIALIRWVCTFDRGEPSESWRGLDILHFEGELLKAKLTYAKAERPLVQKRS